MYCSVHLLFCSTSPGGNNDTFSVILLQMKSRGGMAVEHMTICLQIHCAEVVKHPSHAAENLTCTAHAHQPPDLSSRTIQTDVVGKWPSGRTCAGQCSLKQIRQYTTHPLLNCPKTPPDLPCCCAVMEVLNVWMSTCHQLSHGSCLATNTLRWRAWKGRGSCC